MQGTPTETSLRWADSTPFIVETARACGHDPANPTPAEEAFRTAIAVAMQQGIRSFGLGTALSLAKSLPIGRPPRRSPRRPRAGARRLFADARNAGDRGGAGVARRGCTIVPSEKAFAHVDGRAPLKGTPASCRTPPLPKVNLVGPQSAHLRRPRSGSASPQYVDSCRKRPLDRTFKADHGSANIEPVESSGLDTCRTLSFCPNPSRSRCVGLSCLPAPVDAGRGPRRTRRRSSRKAMRAGRRFPLSRGATV